MKTVDAVDTFKALAHETRLGMLRLLIPAGGRGIAAGDISRQLNPPPNSLSVHPGWLANARLIVRQWSGRNLFCAVDYAHVAEPDTSWRK